MMLSIGSGNLTVEFLNWLLDSILLIIIMPTKRAWSGRAGIVYLTEIRNSRTGGL